MIFHQHDIDPRDTDAHCPYCSAIKPWAESVRIVCLETQEQGRVCAGCADRLVAEGKAIRLGDYT